MSSCRGSGIGENVRSQAEQLHESWSPSYVEVQAEGLEGKLGTGITFEMSINKITNKKGLKKGRGR